MQIYGLYLFPSNDSFKYILGVFVMSAMLELGVVVFILLHI